MMSSKIFLKIIQAYIPPAVVFLFDILVGHIFDVYTLWPPFDIPMHFLGGASMGMTALLLMRLCQQSGWLSVQNKFVSLSISVCFVSLMATLWEFAEFISDHTLGTLMQPSLPDTMLDMFLGLLGGLVAWTIFHQWFFKNK